MAQPQPRALVRVVDDPSYIEAFKRMLVEDALLAFAAEMLEDAPAIAAMQRLGVHGRLVQLLRAILHMRANPETHAEADMRQAMRKLALADRPAPFNTLTPVSTEPRTS